MDGIKHPIDYKGIYTYAQKKGVGIADLTDEEKAMFMPVPSDCYFSPNAILEELFYSLPFPRNPAPVSVGLKKALDELFGALKDLAPLYEGSHKKKIWLNIPDPHSEEEFGNWFELLIIEMQDRNGETDWRYVSVNGQVIVNALILEDPVTENTADNLVQGMCYMLADAAKKSMDLLRKGEYTSYLEKNLPIEWRSGVLKRSDVWEVSPGMEDDDSGYTDRDGEDYIYIQGLNDLYPVPAGEWLEPFGMITQTIELSCTDTPVPLDKVYWLNLYAKLKNS